MSIFSLRPVQTGGLGSVFFYLSQRKHCLPNTAKNSQQERKSKKYFYSLIGHWLLAFECSPKFKLLFFLIP